MENDNEKVVVVDRAVVNKQLLVDGEHSEWMGKWQLLHKEYFSSSI